MGWLDSREIIGADSETLPITPTDAAPPLVCYQHERASQPGVSHVVTRRRGALDVVRSHLEGPAILVLHNGAFDACVWARELGPELIYDKLERGELLCTWVFERLGEIAGHSTRKHLDLATCCKAHGLEPPSLKDAGLATEFGQFIDAEEIPEPYLTYAAEDTIVLKLFQRQLKRFRDVPLFALQRLTYRQFVLALASVQGMAVDGDAAEALRRDAEEKLAELRPLAEQWGFVREDGSRCMAGIREAVELAYGKHTPRTKTGLASTSRLTLEQAPDSPRLKAFALFGEWTKTLTNDVPNLMAGGGVVRTRYGMADTLRTTSSGSKKGARDGVIAMQNLRQSGGIRECLVPRPGHAFYTMDIAGAELCALAQICVSRLGRRETADMIRALGAPGELPTMFGAMLAREPYEAFRARYSTKDDAAVQTRTRAKNAIYGFMGGMGYRTFVDYVRLLSKGKTVISEQESLMLRDAWRQQFPDFAAWLRHVGDRERANGTHDCQLAYGLVRRGVWYSAACNNPFQSYAAWLAAELMIALQRACWTGALWPAKMVLHVHDEFVFEVPERDVDEFDHIVMGIAGEVAGQIAPDVPISWEAEACSVYSKKAKRLTDGKGRLLVWRP